MLRRYSSHGLQTVPLAPNQRVTMGSDPNANIHIQAKGVAPIHASIDYLPVTSSFWLKDHSLTASTKVNDTPVCGQIELRTGDTIRVGESQPFVFDSCSLMPMQGRLSIDREPVDRTSFSLPILGTQIRPNSSGFRAIKGRRHYEAPRSHSRSSSKMTEEPRYTVQMPTNSTTPVQPFGGSSMSDDSIVDERAMGLRCMSNATRRHPPSAHRIGDSLLQRVVRLQAELSERDREIFELRRLQTNGHRSDGRMSVDSLPYVNGSRSDENGSGAAFRLRAYRAFLGCLASQLAAFNDRVLRNPQRDYADVFASFQRALDEPFQAKLFEIERRCEDEFEEAGIEKEQLVRLKDILRADRREKISQLSSELELILPVIRDAASIARESIRVCTIFTQWSRQFGDDIRTEGMSAVILLKYIDKLRDAFTDAQLSRHWLPPSITPVLRLAALKLDGVEHAREPRSKADISGDLSRSNIENASKHSQSIVPKQDGAVQTQLCGGEIEENMASATRLAGIIEQLESEKVSLQEKLSTTRRSFDQLQKSISIKDEIIEDENDEDSVDDAIKRAEEKIDQLQFQLDELAAKIRMVTVFWDLDLKSSAKISQLLDRIFDIVKPIKTLVNYQGKWTFAKKRIIGDIIRKSSKSSLTSVADVVEVDSDEEEEHESQHQYEQHQQIVGESTAARTRAPMLQQQPIVPLDDEFTSWIRDSMEQDNDEEALEIALGNKPKKVGGGDSTTSDEKADNGRVKKGAKMQPSVSVIEEEDEHEHHEHGDEHEEAVDAQKIPIVEKQERKMLEAQSSKENHRLEKPEHLNRRPSMEDQNRNIVIEEELLGLCEAIRRKTGRPAEVFQPDREKLITVPKSIITELMTGITDLLESKSMWSDDDNPDTPVFGEETINETILGEASMSEKRQQRPKSARRRENRTRGQVMMSTKNESGSIDLEEAMKTPKNLNREFILPGHSLNYDESSLKSPLSNGRSVSFDDSNPQLIHSIEKRSVASAPELQAAWKTSNSESSIPELPIEAEIESEPYVPEHSNRLTGEESIENRGYHHGINLDLEHSRSAESKREDIDGTLNENTEVSEEVALLAAKMLVDEAVNAVLKEQEEMIQKEAEQFTTGEGSFDYENENVNEHSEIESPEFSRVTVQNLTTVKPPAISIDEEEESQENKESQQDIARENPNDDDQINADNHSEVATNGKTAQNEEIKEIQEIEGESAIERSESRRSLDSEVPVPNPEMQDDDSFTITSGETIIRNDREKDINDVSEEKEHLPEIILQDQTNDDNSAVATGEKILQNGDIVEHVLEETEIDEHGNEVPEIVLDGEDKEEAGKLETKKKNNHVKIRVNSEEAPISSRSSQGRDDIRKPADDDQAPLTSLGDSLETNPSLADDATIAMANSENVSNAGSETATDAEEGRQNHMGERPLTPPLETPNPMPEGMNENSGIQRSSTNEKIALTKRSNSLDSINANWAVRNGMPECMRSSHLKSHINTATHVPYVYHPAIDVAPTAYLNGYIGNGKANGKPKSNGGTNGSVIIGSSLPRSGSLPIAKTIKGKKWYRRGKSLIKKSKKSNPTTVDANVARPRFRLF